MTCEQCRQNYVPIWKMNDMNTYNLESLEWSHLFIGVGPNGTGKSVHFLSELFFLIFFSMLETLLICVFFTEGCPGWSVCSHWQISSISISCQPQHSEQPGHSRSWLRLLSSSWHSPQTSGLAGIWGLTVSVSGICKQKGWKAQKKNEKSEEPRFICFWDVKEGIENEYLKPHFCIFHLFIYFFPSLVFLCGPQLVLIQQEHMSRIPTPRMVKQMRLWVNWSSPASDLRLQTNLVCSL